MLTDWKLVVWQSKPTVESILYGDSRVLEAAGAILFVYRCMVFLRVLTAFNHQGDELFQLRPSVA